MLFLRNLRARIGVAFFAISLMLSGLYAIATFLSFEVVRPWYADERFRKDVDDFIDRHQSESKLGSWQTATYRAYVAELGDLSTLPARLRGLELGRHQLEHDGEPTEVQVEERGARRYLIEYDIDQIEAIEGEITRFLIALLGGGVLLSSLLALAFGYWMSSRIIQPVTSLARRVENLDAQELLELPLSPHGNDEVAQLSRAFELYTRRLNSSVQREKDFAAAASHELRTSVASISSVVELLMTEDHGEQTGARMERLQRASSHMGRLIEALLVLARPGAVVDGGELAPCSIASSMLRELVDGRQQTAASRGVGLLLNLARASNIVVPSEGLCIVVGNLIDNAIAYAPGSHAPGSHAPGSHAPGAHAIGNHAFENKVHVRMQGNLIEIVDDGPGIPEHELPYIFQRGFRGGKSAGRGAGLGLSIVERLCEHYGWKIEIHSPTGAGTTIRLDLVPGAPLAAT